MRGLIFGLFLLVSSTILCAQKATLSGAVADEHLSPVEYATVALLHPEDSTLAFFGISNNSGAFTVKNVDPGQYLLQISFVGFITYDSLLTVPATSVMQMGTFILRTQLNDLQAVEINALKNPLSIKGDTIEYNAGSYKVQPDASVEDLLKKLPGVEVDQNGNIQAQGETVQKVLVDGKEFFSDDPTVATKNLPADAIDKVQVYDKSSDEAEFTGVDDGLRTKTINLMLKEGKKSMWLGDAQAGAGTEGTYQASAKAYRFTEKNQFAGLGMLNNINQYGFSIHDYIDFNGGIGSLMRSGGFRITSDGDIPVDFGQSVDGLVTSGAGGLNYTHESEDKKRINISYLANGYEKDLQQSELTENFTPGYAYTTDAETHTVTRNYYHRLNYNYQNKSDSLWSLFSTGGISLNYGKSSGENNTSTFQEDAPVNTYYNMSNDRSNGWKADADLTYLRKFSSKWKYIRATANADLKSTLTESQWNNLTTFFPDMEEIWDAQFRNDKNVQLTGSGRISASYTLPKSKYLEPFIAFGGVTEQLIREQGLSGTESTPTDSLSPDFHRDNIWLRPGMALKFSDKQTQWRVSLATEGIHMMHTLDDAAYPTEQYIYFVPNVSYEHEFKKGRRLRMHYSADINTPGASELLPTPDYSNALQIFTGNPDLRPEYSHTFDANWMLFDQFSFTSLFTGVSFGYTHDKINYSREISDDLTESVTLVNVPDDYTANADLHFRTAISPLKMYVSLSLGEAYEQGLNLVNGDKNSITTFTHSGSITFENRKKDTWDASTGISLDYTSAQYSVYATGASDFVTSSWYADIAFTPTEKWRFSASSDIEQYRTIGLSASTTVPMLHAEFTRYFLSANRGSITLKAHDILDRNTGISQTGSLNYLRLTTSNSIGRYFMLSFKYRLNKSDSASGVDIKVNGH